MKKYFPLVPLILCAAWIGSTLAPRKNSSEFDMDGFGRLPVLVSGRVKPLDTVARTSLLQIQGRQSVRSPDGRNVAPAEWLLDVCLDPRAAGQYRVFQIVHPEVLALAQLSAGDGDGGKRFSFAQLAPHIADIERQARLADAAESAQRNSFQRAVLELYGNLIEYHQLQHSLVSPESADFLGELTQLDFALANPTDAASAQAITGARNRFEAMSKYSLLLAVPPFSAQQNWRKTGDALQAALEGGRIPPAAMAYAGLARTWQTKQPSQFNEIVRLYHEQLEKNIPGVFGKIGAEWRFNAAQPFYTSTVLYVLAFLLGVISWLKWPDALGRSAFWVMLLAWLLTTAGIITRMWLEGRPPVTNLYSSALGVGWCAVTLCLVLEAFFKNSIASVAGGLTGFCTLIIAHHLSLGGDTMEMMRAVLDSNFWLATHVVTITVGYGATFLAGMLATIFIVKRLIPGGLSAQTASVIERMVYGIVCFATLFSLIGTVLGGIWADQSWGRFWGWDPKENGALIIVIWNAIVLHARWGKLAAPRGLMAMAVFGNVVTAWSWFGTNLLEVGLHSYGFTDKGALMLGLYVLSQLLVIALAFLPSRAKPRFARGS